MVRQAWPSCGLLVLVLALTLAGCGRTELPTRAPTLPLDETVEVELATPTATATPSPSNTPVPTPTATATPTPEPASVLVEAGQDIAHGDLEQALDRYQYLTAAGETDGATLRAALIGQVHTSLQLGLYGEAVASARQFLEWYPDDPEGDRMSFWLARAHHGLGAWGEALQHYQAYLDLDDTLVAYLSDLMADCHLALGDSAAAVASYEVALTGVATDEQVISLRERLAQAYLAAGDTEAAIAQYAAVEALTDDEEVLARMDYLAGYALVLSDRVEEGHARYLHAVGSYPEAYDAYLALIELVDAGVPVDEFQRGLVDYYAEATIPAISAFYRSIEADPLGHPADPHLYVARIYASMGNYPSAIAELNVLLDTHPNDPLLEEGWLEKAKIQGRSGDRPSAIQTYLNFVDANPESPSAPTALWEAALLWEYDDGWLGASELYRELAANHPQHEDAPQALFRAGLMAYLGGDSEQAVADWELGASWYPESDWSTPSLVWLMVTLPAEEAASYREQVAALPLDGYYAIRAGDLVAGRAPFEPPVELRWPSAEEDALAQVEAETWLREWIGVEPEHVTAVPSALITHDPRWQRGERLWALGLVDHARAELGQLRYALTYDPLANYQLAVAFRDMGLYRSSIIAAATLIRLSPAETPLDAPEFLARLAYPAYYRDLIVAAADRFGLDPLLLLSMIRQESLFEGSARSWAAAQGLMQVIPSTGAEIAGQLGWPNYRDEDLYRPSVSITFGSYYISRQLEAFGGDVYVALSAYNGGPGNAASWVAAVPDDPDLYLESITLGEPRLYIQLIYTHYTHYRALYGSE